MRMDRYTYLKASRTIFALMIVAVMAIASPVAAAPKPPAPPAPPKICDISLSPFHAAQLINTTHVVTVTVLQTTTNAKGQQRCSTPAAGQTVNVHILTGPNAGVTATLTTDVNGQASFSSTSAKPGVEVTLFSVGNMKRASRLFWVDKHGGPGPYGEHDPHVHFNSVGGHTVVMAVATRCYSRSFELFPAFDGAGFVSATLRVDGKFHESSTSEDASYTVDVSKLRKGSTHKLSLTAAYGSGGPVVLTAKFKRCGH